MVKTKIKKNIYQVVDTSSHTVVEVGFQSRQEAKKLRDIKNKEAGKNRFQYIVSRGSDHPLGETDGIDHQTKGKRGRKKKRYIAGITGT